MVPSFTLRNIKVKPDPQAREKTLKRIAQWRIADENLKRVCAERGVEVPIMVC